MAEDIDVRALITILDETGERSRSHGLPREVLEAQARALGIPLIIRASSWSEYTDGFLDALTESAAGGCQICLFGDIDLNDHREWCRRTAARAGLQAVHPLWKESRHSLISEFLRSNHTALIVVVRLSVLDQSFLGREFSDELVSELEALGVDACGENGEFHTVVTGGPLFNDRLDLLIRGEVRVADCAGLQLALGTG